MIRSLGFGELSTQGGGFLVHTYIYIYIDIDVYTYA